MKTLSRSRRPLIAHALTLILCLALLFRVLRLWEADLGVPFLYEGDALLTCMWIKSIGQNGWYLNNPDLGAPFGLEYYDFPFGDTFHFLVLKIFTLFTRNFGLVLNLYFLLSFPLAAASALFVFRRFGLSYPCAILGSLLFTFLPAHLQRGEAHLFLATYYQVPLAVLVALWLGDRHRTQVHFRPVPDSGEGSRPRLRFLASVAICALLSLTGFYYALFGCFFFLIAGAYAALHRRSLLPLVVSGLLIGVTLVGTAANTIPNQIYWRTHGKNAEVAVRDPSHAEIYGLKIAQLLLPAIGHRSARFARVKQRYSQTMPLVNENDIAALGLIGSVGFLILLVCPFLPGSVRLPQGLQRLSVLNLSALLLGTIGGFGVLFALFVSPQIRAYNRISVYIGFFALFAVAACLDRWYRRCAAISPRARLLFCGALVCLLALGVWDQTNGWTYSETRARYGRDARFVGAVEASLPPRAMIFQLPYARFPETPIIHKMLWYSHLLGYLHSRNLRWSYAAMEGRAGARWIRGVSEKPLPEMLSVLSQAGFAGVYINRDAYADGAASLETRLCRLLDTKPIRSEDNRLLFFRIPRP